MKDISDQIILKIAVSSAFDPTRAIATTISRRYAMTVSRSSLKIQLGFQFYVSYKAKTFM